MPFPLRTQRRSTSFTLPALLTAALLFAAPAVPQAASGATGTTGATAPTGATGSTGASGTTASPATTGATGSTATTGAVATTTQVPANPATTNLSLDQQIARLPSIPNAGIDATAQGKLVLAHLNAVLRFYHNASGSIQKVGEPSDILYDEQSSTEAAQVARLAFQGSRNQATLLGKLQGAASTPQTAQPTEAQRVANLKSQIASQSAQLTAAEQSLETQIAKAKPSALPTLRQQQEQVEGGLQLQKAMAEAVNRLGTSTENTNQGGLAGDIDRLQRSAPELAANATKPVSPPPPQSLSNASDAGVSTQAVWLFNLLATLHTIDNQTKDVDVLRKQAEGLRQPIIQLLRNTVQQGQDLSQKAVDLAATPTTDQQDLANTRKTFATLTTQFQVLSAASLPIAQEVALLEQTRGTLTTWRTAVDGEYKLVLRWLLLRVISIAIALLALAGLGHLWSRLTIRYVTDIRRRRQFLVIRRFVIGFLTGVVLILGFVTQFSSLATFAGFITAGIAVGLQSMLLSVAAYFLIIGRYGVRVGDRITVSGITGEVIEVGLVRFYMLELGGSGTELHHTGRVAVFANSVLFSTGTPLYKQLPGTEYAWHELTLHLNPTADIPHVSGIVLAVVNDVYKGYKEQILNQHRAVESWMGTPLPDPAIESHLQLADAGLQYTVLFPVEISQAADVDSKLATDLLARLNADPVAQAASSAPPTIKASIK